MNIIVAVSANGVIGNNGKMPWRLPKEMKLFKKITTPHTIIMGRYTFESIGKPLLNRKNIVLSTTLPLQNGILIARNWQEVFSLVARDEQVFIIGGQQLFEYALQNNLIKKIYKTVIHHNFEGDTFFPEVDWAQWKLQHQTFYAKDEKNPYDFTTEIWVKDEKR